MNQLGTAAVYPGIGGRSAAGYSLITASQYLSIVSCTINQLSTTANSGSTYRTTADYLGTGLEGSAGYVAIMNNLSTAVDSGSTYRTTADHLGTCFEAGTGYLAIKHQLGTARNCSGTYDTVINQLNTAAVYGGAGGRSTTGYGLSAALFYGYPKSISVSPNILGTINLTADSLTAR